MTAIASPPPSERAAALTELTQGVLRRIQLSELVESPWNPRKHWDPVKLAEMADSLRKGQLTPITVRPIVGKHDRYEIGAGHRRYRAAPAAGLTSLLAVVREIDDVAFLELLTIENKQREDVAPLDEAAGFRLLMEKAGYDVAKLAARIGLSTKYVYDRLKLLQLVPEAKQYLEDGTITAGHAILLARLTPADQKRVMGNPKTVNRAYGAGSGLWEGEEADHDPDQPGLELKLPVKAVSVRELATYINDHVRFRPEENDLPNLFPAAAAALQNAEPDDLDPVYITYDHVLRDSAKDGKQRTYSVVSWRRADGKQKSKVCDWSRIGIVAAGRDRGDAFRVCVNRDKCVVHFSASARRKKKSAPASGGASSVNDTSIKANLKREQEQERQELVDAQIGILIKERSLPWANEVMALAGQIKMPKQIAEYLAADQGAVSRGLEDIVDGYDDDVTQHAPDILAAIRGRLPGKWATGYNHTPKPRDEKAAIVGLALLFWFATATKKLDDELDAAAEKIVKAAEAVKPKKVEKKPAQKKAKKGSR